MTARCPHVWRLDVWRWNTFTESADLTWSCVFCRLSVQGSERDGPRDPRYLRAAEVVASSHEKTPFSVERESQNAEQPRHALLDTLRRAEPAPDGDLCAIADVR